MALFVRRQDEQFETGDTMRMIRQSILWLTIGAGVLAACGGNEPDANSVVQDTQTAQQAGAKSDTSASQTLTDVTWQWVGLTTPKEQVSVPAPDRYTIRFTADGRVSVRADCNRGNGRYTVTPDRRITISPLALTRAACPEGSLSDRFGREIVRASIYFFREGDLYIDLPMDSGTLRFKRAS